METWSSGRMGTSRYRRPFLCRDSTRSVSASFSFSPAGMAALVHRASSFSERFLYSTSPAQARLGLGTLLRSANPRCEDPQKGRLVPERQGLGEGAHTFWSVIICLSGGFPRRAWVLQM